MQNTKTLLAIGTICGLVLASYGPLYAQENTDGTLSGKVYLMPYAGVAILGDISATLRDGSVSQDVNITTGVGYSTGMALGYRLFGRVTLAAGWEYKSNPSDMERNGSKYSGNYASTTISLDGHYWLMPQAKLKPFVGLGAAYIQEIDLDYEGAEGEVSFSDNLVLGMGLVAGLRYSPTRRWSFDATLKHFRFPSVDLVQENGSETTLADINYNPIVVNFSAVFTF